MGAKRKIAYGILCKGRIRNITLENVYNIIYTEINIISIDVFVYQAIDLYIKIE